MAESKTNLDNQLDFQQPNGGAMPTSSATSLSRVASLRLRTLTRGLSSLKQEEETLPPPTEAELMEVAKKLRKEIIKYRVLIEEALTQGGIGVGGSSTPMKSRGLMNQNGLTLAAEEQSSSSHANKKCFLPPLQKRNLSIGGGGGKGNVQPGRRQKRSSSVTSTSSSSSSVTSAMTEEQQEGATMHRASITTTSTGAALLRNRKKSNAKIERKITDAYITAKAELQKCEKEQMRSVKKDVIEVHEKRAQDAALVARTASNNGELQNILRSREVVLANLIKEKTAVEVGYYIWKAKNEKLEVYKLRYNEIKHAHGEEMQSLRSQVKKVTQQIQDQERELLKNHQFINDYSMRIQRNAQKKNVHEVEVLQRLQAIVADIKNFKELQESEKRRHKVELQGRRGNVERLLKEINCFLPDVFIERELLQQKKKKEKKSAEEEAKAGEQSKKKVEEDRRGETPDEEKQEGGSKNNNRNEEGEEEEKRDKKPAAGKKVSNLEEFLAGGK